MTNMTLGQKVAFRLSVNLALHFERIGEPLSTEKLEEIVNKVASRVDSDIEKLHATLDKEFTKILETGEDRRLELNLNLLEMQTNALRELGIIVENDFPATLKKI